MDTRTLFLRRFFAVMLLVGVASLMIFINAVKISVIQGSSWRAKADSLYVKERPIQAPRGNIYAADGSLLVTSLPFFEVFFDTKAPEQALFDANVDSLSYYLVSLMPQGATMESVRDWLITARAEGNRYLCIKKEATYPEVQRLKRFPLFNMPNSNRSGLIVKQVNRRQYPFKMLAHRTLGYVRDSMNPIGIEGYFDYALRGDEGKQLERRVGKDLWIPLSEIGAIEPKSGKDVVTTLDMNIQDVTEGALLQAIQQYEAKNGCAIVMEIETGAIRAIANIGRAEDTTFWETYNFAIGDAVEPGSTFKAAAMLALLEDGYVRLDDSINLHGGKLKFYEEEMIDGIAHGLYETSVQHAFEVSSNVGIAKLINKFYNESGRVGKFLQHLKDFHLNEPTNIEIFGEAKPFIKEPSREDFSKTTLPWMAIGYELQITAIQQLMFYNAVGNGGKMMKPYIVSEIREFDRSIKRISPKVIDKRIAGSKAIADLNTLLTAVVENGTAKDIRSRNYPIAGKTGTAVTNYSESNRKLESKRYRASFAGYFPADKPRYSCIVVITEPKTGLYGATVAAPVFRKIADYCYARDLRDATPLNKSKVKLNSATLPTAQAGWREDLYSLFDYFGIPYNYRSAKSDWVAAFAANDSLLLSERSPKPKTIPSVLGMGLRDALHLMENAGISVQIKGQGKVRAQSIKAGTPVKGKRTVILELK